MTPLPYSKARRSLPMILALSLGSWVAIVLFVQGVKFAWAVIGGGLS